MAPYFVEISVIKSLGYRMSMHIPLCHGKNEPPKVYYILTMISPKQLPYFNYYLKVNFESKSFIKVVSR